MKLANWKDVTQYSTAVISLASGIVLSFLQFFAQGDLSSGVLGYVGQTLLYAAAIFGATIYWNGKYLELRNIVKNGNTRMDSDSLENAR